MPSWGGEMWLVLEPWRLIEAPELGMGYQFARRVVRNQSRSDAGGEHAIVIHSLVALGKHELYRPYFKEKIESVFRNLDRIISLRQFPAFHFSRDEPRAIHPGLEQLEGDIFEIENNANAFLEFMEAPNWMREKYMERRVHESPPYDRSARLADVMYRYSLLRSDPRVGPNGELAPGTYAAPSSDMPFVPTGFSAVGRYALPALLPRCYRFKIAPPDGTAMKVGACQPSFGQAGGGVEIEFTSALPAGSASFDSNIPEF